MTQEEIAIKITEHDGQLHRHEGRIKAIEQEQKALQELATSVAVLAEQIKSMNEKMDTLTGEVTEIKEKPTRRWESLFLGVLKAIGYSVVGALVTYAGIMIGTIH